MTAGAMEDQQQQQQRKPRIAPQIIRRHDQAMSRGRAALLLIAITIAAGVMRFALLTRQPLWIDECFTFWRVCGSYNQLLETLRDDGFVPLHYQLLWWIGRHWPLTPFVMRFVPALCGTLLVPIMYFLARQMFGRRTALVAALFIACSAYVSNYARDAKMYMPAWTFATLMMACLLWWVRTKKLIAWEAWIASGLAAAGCHVVTMLLLPIAPILVLSQSRHRWQQSIWMLLGLAIIAAGPLGYYTQFNQWNKHSGGLVPGVGAEPAADANWHASGLDWIRGTVDGWDITSQSASAFLTAYEWHGVDNLDSAIPSRPWVATAIKYAVVATLAIFALGVIPWPYRWRGTARDGDPPNAWWRCFLMLLAWLLIPGYCFFYCRSAADFATPWEILQEIPTLGIRWNWWLLGAFVLLVAWFFSGGTFRQRLTHLVEFLLVCAVLFLICTIAAIVWRQLRDESFRRFPDLAWQNVFQVRYIGIVMPAVWLIAATLVMRLPFRITRWLAVLILIAINLTNAGARIFGDTEVPMDRFYADCWNSRPSTTTRTYEALHAMGFFNLLDNSYWRPAGVYNAWLASRLEISPELARLGKSWPFEYGPMMDQFRKQTIVGTSIEPDRIAADLKADPEITRVIVWEFIQPDEPNNTDDEVTTKLGPAWRRIKSESFAYRRYWTWEEMFWVRRREYLRG